MPGRVTFVHVYKTGGTSIGRALQAALVGGPFAPWILSNRFASNLSKQTCRRMGWLPTEVHASAEEIRKTVGDDAYETTFSFGIVRNPWDWQVSLYEFMRQTPKHFQHSLVAGMDFASYIRWRVGGEYHLQQEYIAEDGRNRVDFVGRFEDLGGAWERVRSETVVRLDLPHLNATRRLSYRDYYTDELRDLVATTFAPDIERFGYEF